MKNLVEGMVKSAPHPQNAFDIFQGEWAYDIPIAGTKSGLGSTFHHKHYSVYQSELAFGSLKGMKCLELGPNEGEVSFHLHHAGCREVVSIEARIRAYLKCLIVKNFLHLDSVRFHLGDFVQFLEMTNDRFDLGMAAGVLYHMTNPIRLLELLAKSCDRIAIASHYFNESMLHYDPRKDTSGLGDAVWNIVDPKGEDFTHAGIKVKYFKYQYAGSRYLNDVYAHGGPEAYACLMRVDDIVRILNHFGMKIVGEINDDPEGPRGAHVFLTAERK